MKTLSARLLAALALIAPLTSPALAPPPASAETPLAPLAADAWQGIQHDLARREYHASRTDRGLQAPNRAQGFRTWFEPAGVQLVDRDSGDPLLRLQLTAWGRGRLAAAGEGEVRHDGARVEIVRPGLVEWYENRPEGLEQGFTLARRPAGRGPLRLRLAVEGARAEGEGEALTLVAGERRLRYGKLKVWDADGTMLAATLQARRGGIELRVADAGARYPVTIDPLLNGNAPDAQLQGGQAFAWFGNSVAGAGDVNGDGYDDVVVGARYFDSGQADEGAAFVYFGGPGAFDTVADAQLQGGQAFAWFGNSVAGAGDVNDDGYDDVIVGAQYFDQGETSEGAAFVYFGGLGEFDTVADAHLQVNQAQAQFGFSVAGAGDVNGDGYDDVIVGAPFFAQGETNEGAAFIYFGRPGAFDTVADASLMEGNQAFVNFGLSVAGAGDVNGDGYDDVVVGAPYFDSGQTNEGAAFVYFGGPGAFNAVADASLMDGNQAGATFGASVAGAGDVNGDGYDDVVVGAPFFDSGQTSEGAAFVYFGGPGAFNAVADASLMEGNQAYATFGDSVAGAGDVNGDGFDDVVVGARLFCPQQPDATAAYLYLGGPGPFETLHAQRLRIISEDDIYSLFVAGAGDVDGDGVDDLIAGVPGYGAGGAAFLYRGNDRLFRNGFQLGLPAIDPCP